jgi:hypothetical protein
MNAPIPDRKKAVERIKHWLERRSMPRLQMSIIVFVTALAGFLSSFLLLQLGLTRMGIRYLLAVGFAYAAFFGLLRLWLRYHRPQTADRKTAADAEIDALDWLDPDLLSSSKTTSAFEFGGGASGGGGAARSFGAGMLGDSENAGAGWKISDALDGDDGTWIIALFLAVIGGVIAATYIIVSAPAFLAEILVDGVLAAGLYKRLRRIDRRNWLETALRKTWLPVLIVALLFLVAGHLIQANLPEVDSIGDIWRLSR